MSILESAATEPGSNPVKVVVCSPEMDGKNKLHFGDNLQILRDHVADASIDLIYLDPPFNSNATYNVLFKEKSGEESAPQITAFEDTWQWSVEAEAVYKEIVSSGPKSLGPTVQVRATLAMSGSSRQIERQITYVSKPAPLDKGVEHLLLILVPYLLNRLLEFVQATMVNAIQIAFP